MSVTTVSSGQTVVVTTNASLGSDPVVFDGGTIQAGADNLEFSNTASVNSTNGAFDVNGDTLTWDGVISNGTGAPAGVLTLADSSGGGHGVLVLTGTNTYSGGIVISAGELSISANANLGVGSITLNGGAADYGVRP